MMNMHFVVDASKVRSLLKDGRNNSIHFQHNNVPLKQSGQAKWSAVSFY